MYIYQCPCGTLFYQTNENSGRLGQACVCVGGGGGGRGGRGGVA